VVISSYLPEILAVSDRILVARTGRMVAEFDAAEATQGQNLVRGGALTKAPLLDASAPQQKSAK
jgi:ABC-type uncharacterized transport system ATPase subunit